MNGMIMWIVLGVLIGLVVLFLVVTSVLDRKKTKKINAAKAILKAEADSAEGKILIFANKIFEKNQKLLDEFIPSIGKIKMIDVRNKAKDALKILKSSKNFKILIQNEGDEKTINAINSLNGKNANTWAKDPAVIFIKEALKNIDQTKDEYVTFEKEVEELLKEVY